VGEKKFRKCKEGGTAKIFFGPRTGNSRELCSASRSWENEKSGGKQGRGQIEGKDVVGGWRPAGNTLSDRNHRGGERKKGQQFQGNRGVFHERRALGKASGVPPYLKSQKSVLYAGGKSLEGYQEPCSGQKSIVHDGPLREEVKRRNEAQLQVAQKASPTRRTPPRLGD